MEGAMRLTLDILVLATATLVATLTLLAGLH
jgi:hypothetical protein